MSKHTPGPWQAEGPLIGKRMPPGEEWRHIATVETGSADERLIAAAPELLEAAQMAEIWLTEPVGSAARVLASLRNAIAKATGEAA